MISYQNAKEALFSVKKERQKAGSLPVDSEDYFWGCHDRWSMVIRELSRYPGTDGHILDIGA